MVASGLVTFPLQTCPSPLAVGFTNKSLVRKGALLLPHAPLPPLFFSPLHPSFPYFLPFSLLTFLYSLRILYMYVVKYDRLYPYFPFLLFCTFNSFFEKLLHVYTVFWSYSPPSHPSLLLLPTFTETVLFLLEIWTVWVRGDTSYFSESGTFCLTRWSPGTSISLSVVQFHSFTWLNYPPLCSIPHRLIHLSTDRHLSWSGILAVVNGAVAVMDTQVFGLCRKYWYTVDCLYLFLGGWVTSTVVFTLDSLLCTPIKV